MQLWNIGIQHSFAVVSLLLRITTSCKKKYYLPSIHIFSNFFKSLPQFLPLQVEETYFFQEAITISGFTSLGRNNNKVFIFSTFWLLFHYFNIYLIMHFKLFSSFFQFLPLKVEETYFFRDGLNQGLIRFLPPGGRNLPTLLAMVTSLSHVEIDFSSSEHHCLFRGLPMKNWY